MEDFCVWFVVWTRNRFFDDWYETAKFRSFAACKRFADSVLDKYSMMDPEFKFEKVCYFNGTVVKREFIA